jgi:hypothetical protein
MRDTSAICDCCGEREQAGQCVKGRVMCPCEVNQAFISLRVLECRECKKCPVHCLCDSDKCICRELSTPNMFFGHHRDCPVRVNCRERIKKNSAIGFGGRYA